MSIPPPQRQASEERTWGMLCHLSALSWMVGVPFGNILGPLIIWLVKKDQYPFVDDQGKESLNFQISIAIYLFTLGILAIPAIIAAAFCFPLFFLLIPLGLALLLMKLVCVIMGAIAANEGRIYRYPLTIRFLK